MDFNCEKGQIFVLSGPSGVGKETICHKLINDKELNLKLAISMTSREKRKYEKEGVDYFFVSKEEFQQAIQDNKLLEYVEFVSNYYGTLLSEVNKIIEAGNNVLLEIEVQGAKQILAKVPSAVSIFLIPPTIEVLKERLLNRNTESTEIIELRIAKATYELLEKDHYKYVVINDDINRAANEIKELIKREIR